MAAQRSKKRSRKRRTPGSAPRAVPAQRRQRNLVSEPASGGQDRRPQNPLGPYGERPPSPFGGLPVSEVAIFAGAVGLIVGLFNQGGPALVVGVIVCTLGVIEVTAREHFSGYRSHTTLLAAIPAVLAEVAVVGLVGAPGERLLLLLVVIPVYLPVFWLLRRRFRSARQARVARAPGAAPRH
jgi:hypothetical protein